MRVEKENNNSNAPLVLWHIQNMNITSVGSPFDTFVWSDHELDDDELEKIIREEIDANDDEVKEFLTTSFICPVYAEHIDEYGGIIGAD